MLTKEWIVKAICALVIVASLVGGCSYVNKKAKLEDDHWLEEYIEQYLNSKLGLDIDLTPATEED